MDYYRGSGAESKKEPFADFNRLSDHTRREREEEERRWTEERRQLKPQVDPGFFKVMLQKIPDADTPEANAADYQKFFDTYLPLIKKLEKACHRHARGIEERFVKIARQFEKCQEGISSNCPNTVYEESLQKILKNLPEIMHRIRNSTVYQQFQAEFQNAGVDLDKQITRFLDDAAQLSRQMAAPGYSR